MARTTHVKSAQQRYETVPVLDDEGNPKKVPVMRNGEQRRTKKGKPIFMTLTVVDKSKPKPLYTCSACNKPIEIGTPYKHISPKSGPYGGRKMTRHESCPGWQVWDYSNSLSAQLSRISYDFGNAIDQAESPDDVKEALSDASASIKEIAEQKREGASNIEDGFGHATSQSEELESMADDLENWADEVESADVPDLPDAETVTKYFVNGPDAQSLDEDGFETQEDAENALEQHLAENEDESEDDWDIEEVEVDSDEITEEQLDEWRDEVRDNVTIVDESPV
jgi:adenylate kinase family enzyme